MACLQYKNFKRTREPNLYKFVYQMVNLKDASIAYLIRVGGNSKLYKNEREAAIAVDKFLLNHGKEPVNILVRK